jgi:hypothetical protein
MNKETIETFKKQNPKLYKKFMRDRNRTLRNMSPEDKAMMKHFEKVREEMYDFDELNKYKEMRLLMSLKVAEKENRLKNEMKRWEILALARKKIPNLRQKHTLSCLCSMRESCAACDDDKFISAYSVVWLEAIEMAQKELMENKSYNSIVCNYNP